MCRLDGMLTVLFRRFQENVLNEITGSEGNGKIRTYIHVVYPWEKIQEGHRTMQADSNAYVLRHHIKIVRALMNTILAER